MEHQRKRRYLMCAAVGAVLCFLAGGLLLWSPLRQPKDVSLPPDSDVASMTAMLTGYQGVTRTVPEFTVPPEYIPKLLSAFRPAEKGKYPDLWDRDELARLKLMTTNGKVFSIAFGFSGKSPLCFTFDGYQCGRAGRYDPIAINSDDHYEHYASECLLVAHILDYIKREIETGTKSPKIDRYFEDLERSAGDRPSRVASP